MSSLQVRKGGEESIKKMRSINSEKSEGLASRNDLFGHQIYKQNSLISVEGTHMYKLSILCGLTL